MNKLFVPLAIFFGLYSLWLFADNILDVFSGFARIWWLQYHILLKASMFIMIKLLSVFWGIDAFIIDYRNIALPAGQEIPIYNFHLGLDVFVMFACFIIAWPASWKTRLWYIPAGMLFLYLLNVLFMTLAVSKAYYIPPTSKMPSPSQFKTILYLITLGLWLLFIRYFGNRQFLASIDGKKIKEKEKTIGGNKNIEA